MLDIIIVIIRALQSIKTEWYAFLLVFIAIIANRYLELGLTFEELVALATLSGVYVGGRSLAKGMDKFMRR